MFASVVNVNYLESQFKAKENMHTANEKVICARHHIIVHVNSNLLKQINVNFNHEYNCTIMRKEY